MVPVIWRLAVSSLVLSMTTPLSAQTMNGMTHPADELPKTDADKIASAMRGGPDFITEDATILDWPATPSGDFRVLRKGTSQWTCLSGIPIGRHDEPGCYDPVYLQWIRDSYAGRTPSVRKIGVSYMYMGKFLPNKSGKLTAAPEFHVGPHIMIVVPHEQQELLAGMSRDGSDGQFYVNQLGPGKDFYLVIPVSQWPTR